MNYWAVIPSRSRRACLATLVTDLTASDVNVVVVDNGYDPPVHAIDLCAIARHRVHIIRHDETPPNISRLWNVGLRYVSERESDEYVVAVLNDDLRVPPLFVQQLGCVIQRHGAAAAFPDVHTRGYDIVLNEPGPVSLTDRLTGFAFALRGGANILADENLCWWYGDDDIDWRARQLGGCVLAGGVAVQHLHPNETTVGELAAQAGRDRATFVQKWGVAPW